VQALRRGRPVLIVSPKAQLAWRDDPEHLEAQSRGRSDFYFEYDIMVSHITYRSGFGVGTADIDIASDADRSSDISAAAKQGRD